MMTQMKKSAIALAVASAFWGATAVADNNDDATAKVSGEVIASLAIAEGSNLILPTVVLPDANEDTFVQINCANDGVTTVTYDALGGNPYAAGNAAKTDVTNGANQADKGDKTGTCATFAVTGQADYNYSISASGTSITDTAVGTGLVLSDLNCIAEGGTSAGGALTSGAANVYCGGKLTVDELASAGTIAEGGEITVVVVYD